MAVYCWIAVDTHNAVATEASVANTCSNPSMPSTRCFLRHALVSYLAVAYNLWSILFKYSMYYFISVAR